MARADVSVTGSPASAQVTFGGQCWTLAVGATLTIGRGRGCDVLLPDDDHLSRRAASLSVMTDCVLVRNDSSSKPFVLRPTSGEDRVLEPGAATTSLPWRAFQLVFTGRAGAALTVPVDAAELSPPPRLDRVTLSKATLTQPISLTGAQRRILAALCEPLLTRTGPEAAPATYAQIAARLTLKPHYVRNVVKSIRESLTGHGLPGLSGDDSAEAGDDFRWPLARWAVRSGWVTTDDLAELP
jgi:hypothetical protein